MSTSSLNYWAKTRPANVQKYSKVQLCTVIVQYATFLKQQLDKLWLSNVGGWCSVIWGQTEEEETQQKIGILFKISCFPLGDCSLLTEDRGGIMGHFILLNLTSFAIFSPAGPTWAAWRGGLSLIGLKVLPLSLVKWHPQALVPHKGDQQVDGGEANRQPRDRQVSVWRATAEKMCSKATT